MLAIYDTTLSKQIVSASRFYNNSSVRGGAALYISMGYIDIIQSEIEENVALEDGGGIYSFSTCEVSILDSMISNNYASALGAGIYTEGMLSCEDSILSDNDASTLGDGVAISGTSALLMSDACTWSHPDDDLYIVDTNTSYLASDLPPTFSCSARGC